MSKEVKIKDYDFDVHVTKIALNMAGLTVDYPTTELIFTVLKTLEKEGEKMDISHTVKIQKEHKEKWENYFKNLENE